MLLTDPPYGTTRNFWDVPLPLTELWEAVKWAVKPEGAVLFFAQCPYDKVLGASNLAMLRYEWVWYHRLTRTNTPDSVSFRRFLPFSPYWASAQLRLKSQKSLENTSLAGASSFVGAEMCPDKKRPAGNTCRIAKGLDAVWAHFCPSKPCLPLSTDGTKAAARAFSTPAALR